MQKKSCHGTIHLQQTNSFVTNQNRIVYGWTLSVLTFILISFIDSHFHFIYLCIHNRIEAVARSAHQALPQNIPKKKWTTHYPCGQKLMIWKIANKTKAIFHFVCMHFSLCSTEDDAVLNFSLATGNNFGGNACDLSLSLFFGR